MDYLRADTPLPQFLPYPRFLLDSKLNQTARLVYALLLDRATLSQKNGWVDDAGNVFVVYPIENLAKDLKCTTSSIVRALKELERAGFVERKRTAFSAPNHLFLRFPPTVQNCAVILSKNDQYDSAKMTSMTMQECTPNQPNKNQPNKNQPRRGRGGKNSGKINGGRPAAGWPDYSYNGEDTL